MKKFSAILFSVMYLGLSTGNVLSYSTCKDVAVSVFGIRHSAAKTGMGICHCGKKDGLQASEQARGCCGNNAKVVKLDNRIEKVIPGNNFSKISNPSVFTRDAVFTLFGYKNPIKSKSIYPYTKVAVRGVPLYILHCVYRF